MKLGKVNSLSLICCWPLEATKEFRLPLFTIFDSRSSFSKLTVFSCRTLMWCIWIAFKIFDDSLIENRYFAYLTNVDLKDFNKLEMDVMKRLDFNALIDQEMFSNYQEQLEWFAESQSECLQESLDQYQRDKQTLKNIKHQIMHSCQSAGIHSKVSNARSNNYADHNLKKILESRGWCEQNVVFPHCVSKFRFESYNSYNFKSVYKNSITRRGRSVPVRTM